ncbi:polysaccharide pyruvyl transferase CsaB [Desulfonispora thiosulfatigenes DSM 11270]|uniref:Polysaccharide pyruvyl transferase CsaB n=1 Tax=Desulfonispora thiosulfatigenes DSM 11270 TaxID=656914 RepID=A0A1W1V4Y1_DESTI|nr:polysaccharide pyruvyl transferase family protein [Desulfonispora thiosulfatigenes]SMB88457.1 polysaccharide pyruvyl transferase CsaB [Desulfonispora thiosulfatigenes DSM 11270]
MRKKILIYSQGIGPVTDKRNRLLTGIILNKVAAITVRDTESKKDLEDMKIKQEIILAADPVLGNEAEEIDENIGQELLELANVDINKKLLAVSLREWPVERENYEAIARTCDHFAAEGWEIIFLPMHFPDDISAGREVLKEMKEEAVLLKQNYSPYETLCILKKCDLIVSMRLHALIMGAVVQKPIVAISYDPKIDSFMQSLGFYDILQINNLKENKLTGQIQTAWDQKDTIISDLKVKSRELKIRALIPAEKAQELLKDNLLSKAKQ